MKKFYSLFVIILLTFVFGVDAWAVSYVVSPSGYTTVPSTNQTATTSAGKEITYHGGLIRVCATVNGTTATFTAIKSDGTVFANDVVLQVREGSYDGSAMTTQSVSANNLKEVSINYTLPFTSGSRTYVLILVSKGTQTWYYYTNPITITAVTSTLTAPSTLTATEKQPNSFVAKWSSVSAATSYDVQVSTSSSFTSTVFTKTGNKSNGVVVTGLTPSKTYYYRVRSVNSSSTSSWSSASSAVPTPARNTSTTEYTTTPQGYAPAPTVKTSATVNGSSVTLYGDIIVGKATMSGSTATFTVKKSDLTTFQNATSLYLMKDNVSGTAVKSASGASGASEVTLTYTIPSSVTTSAQYHLVLCSKASSGNIWYYTTPITIVVPQTGGSAPTAPTGLSTSDTQAHSFILNWSAPSGATSYDVQVGTTSSFSTLKMSKTDYAQTGVVVAGVSPSTTYYYRVRAKNASGTSSWSSVSSLTTKSYVTSSTDYFTTPQGYGASPTTDMSGTVNGSSATLHGEVIVAKATMSGSTATFTVRKADTSTFMNATTVYLMQNSPTGTAVKQVSGSAGATTLTLSYTIPSSVANSAKFYLVLCSKGTQTSWYYSSPITVFVPESSSTANSVPGKADHNQFTASDYTTTGFKACWAAVDGATTYNINVKKASDANYDNKVFALTNISGTSAFVTGLQPNTDYKFQIQAVNKYGAGQWSSSSTRTFTTSSSGTTTTLTKLKVYGVNGFAESSLTLNQRSTYTVGVYNGNTSEWRGNLKLMEGDQVVNTWEDIVLSGNSGKTYECSYTPTSVGQKEFTMYYQNRGASIWSLVKEGSLSNPITITVKEASLQSTVLQLSQAITSDLETVLLGKTATISTKVKNVSSTDFTGTIVLHYDETYVVKKVTLKAGGFSTIFGQWTPTTAGSYKVSVTYYPGDNKSAERLVNGGNYDNPVYLKAVSGIDGSKVSEAQISLITKGLAPESVAKGACVHYFFRVTDGKDVPLSNISATFSRTVNGATKSSIVTDGSSTDGIIVLPLATEGTNAIAGEGETARLVLRSLSNAQGTVKLLGPGVNEPIVLKIREKGPFGDVASVNLTVETGVSAKGKTLGDFLTIGAGISLPVEASIVFNDNNEWSKLSISKSVVGKVNGGLDLGAIQAKAGASAGAKYTNEFSTTNKLATVILGLATWCGAFTQRDWLISAGCKTFENWYEKRQQEAGEEYLRVLTGKNESVFYGYNFSASMSFLSGKPGKGLMNSTSLPSLGIDGFSLNGSADFKYTPMQVQNDYASKKSTYTGNRSLTVKMGGEMSKSISSAFSPKKPRWIGAGMEEYFTKLMGVFPGANVSGSKTFALQVKEEESFENEACTDISKISTSLGIIDAGSLSVSDLNIHKDWMPEEEKPSGSVSQTTTFNFKLTSGSDWAKYLYSQRNYQAETLGKVFPVFKQEGLVAGLQSHYNIWFNGFEDSLDKLASTTPNAANYAIGDNMKFEQQVSSTVGMNVSIPIFNWKPWGLIDFKFNLDLGLSMSVANRPSVSYYSVADKRFFPVVLNPATTIKAVAGDVSNYIQSRINAAFEPHRKEVETTYKQVTNLYGTGYNVGQDVDVIYTNGFTYTPNSAPRLTLGNKRRHPALATAKQDDICIFTLTIDGQGESFNDGTQFQFMHFYPAGDLIGITDKQDTLFVVSEVINFRAEEDLNQLQKAPNGKFMLETKVGADDLTPFGLSPDTPLDIYHAAIGSSEWHYVGPAGETVMVDSLGAYIMATPMVNDTMAPELNATLSKATGLMKISVTDNIGVKNSSLMVTVNGQQRETVMVDYNTFYLQLGPIEKNMMMVVYATIDDLAGNHGQATQVFNLDAASLGDANGDGQITMTDANVITNYYTAGSSDNIITKNADLNNDGEISMADANAIVNYYVNNK